MQNFSLIRVGLNQIKPASSYAFNGCNIYRSLYGWVGLQEHTNVCKFDCFQKFMLMMRSEKANVNKDGTKQGVTWWSFVTCRSSLAPVLLSTSISSDCARKSLNTGDNLSGCASSGVPFVAIKYKAYNTIREWHKLHQLLLEHSRVIVLVVTWKCNKVLHYKMMV